jgi:hypothetical protein
LKSTKKSKKNSKPTKKNNKAQRKKAEKSINSDSDLSVISHLSTKHTDLALYFWPKGHDQITQRKEDDIRRLDRLKEFIDEYTQYRSGEEKKIPSTFSFESFMEKTGKDKEMKLPQDYVQFEQLHELLKHKRYPAISRMKRAIKRNVNTWKYTELSESLTKLFNQIENEREKSVEKLNEFIKLYTAYHRNKKNNEQVTEFNFTNEVELLKTFVSTGVVKSFVLINSIIEAIDKVWINSSIGKKKQKLKIERLNNASNRLKRELLEYTDKDLNNNVNKLIDVISP